MPGDQDIQCPPWVMRRQLAHIPDAEFIVLPEAPHSINWEQAEAFNRHVLEFIASISRFPGQSSHSDLRQRCLKSSEVVQCETVSYRGF
jgi:hypothetical protein